MTVELVEDKKHKNLYRLQWPDGSKSVNTPHPDQKDGHYGFYNIDRAKELLKLSNIEKLKVGRTYNSPWARLEARGCV